jgi:hypothetical protein
MLEEPHRYFNWVLQGVHQGIWAHIEDEDVPE